MHNASCRVFLRHFYALYRFFIQFRRIFMRHFACLRKQKPAFSGGYCIRFLSYFIKPALIFIDFSDKDPAIVFFIFSLMIFEYYLVFFSFSKYFDLA